jgi:hypothetical protein
VATGQCGLLIFDLADPASPQLVDSLMSETNNLPIVIRNPDGFTQIGYTWMLTNAALRAYLQKQYSPKQLPDMKEIVETLRDTSFYADILVRQTQLPRRLHGLHVLGQYALALGPGLEVIDLTDATKPRRAGGFALDIPTCDVRGAGRYAYVMDNGANIHVFDLSDLTRPVKVGRFDAHGFASHVLPVAEVGRPVNPTPEEAYADVPVVAGPPELVDPQRLANGAFAFTLVGLGNATYVVQASADLASWTPISTNGLPAEGRLRITDTEATAHPHRYYRAVRQ